MSKANPCEGKRKQSSNSCNVMMVRSERRSHYSSCFKNTPQNPTGHCLLCLTGVPQGQTGTILGDQNCQWRLRLLKSKKEGAHMPKRDLNKEHLHVLWRVRYHWGPGAVRHPLRFLIRPDKLQEMIKIAGKSKKK